MQITANFMHKYRIFWGKTYFKIDWKSSALIKLMRFSSGLSLQVSFLSTMALRTGLAFSTMNEWAGKRQTDSLSLPAMNTMSACSSLLNRTSPGLGADGCEPVTVSLGAICFGQAVDGADDWPTGGEQDSEEMEDVLVAPELDEEEEVSCGEGETDMYWTRFLGLDFALRFRLHEMHWKDKQFRTVKSRSELRAKHRALDWISMYRLVSRFVSLSLN